VESAGGCISVSPSYWSFASGRAPGTGHSIIVAAQRNQQTGKHAFFAVVLLLLLMQRATTTKANPDMMISTRREDKGMREREREVSTPSLVLSSFPVSCQTIVSFHSKPGNNKAPRRREQQKRNEITRDRKYIVIMNQRARERKANHSN
jgi:hypothetical protein